MMKLRLTFTAITIAFSMAACGGDDSVTTPSTTPPALTGLGNISFGCGGSGGGTQQKPVQFQQQQSCGQSFQFQQQKVSDFDVTMDCDNKTVLVKSKGKDQQQQQFAIMPDGSVKGKMQFQQQMGDDGKSHQECWVEFVVDFDGHANCPKPGDGGQPDKKLSLSTTVDIGKTDPSKLANAGIQPGPAGYPSPEPSVSPSPVPSASVSPGPSPSPSVTPTLIPIIVCEVDVDCQVTANSDLTCPQ